MKDLRGDEWMIGGIPSHEFNKEELDAVWMTMVIGTMGVKDDETRAVQKEAEEIIERKVKSYNEKINK